jgi:hypothetical protein
MEQLTLEGLINLLKAEQGKPYVDEDTVVYWGNHFMGEAHEDTPNGIVLGSFPPEWNMAHTRLHELIAFYENIPECHCKPVMTGNREPVIGIKPDPIDDDLILLTRKAA